MKSEGYEQSKEKVERTRIRKKDSKIWKKMKKVPAFKNCYTAPFDKNQVVSKENANFLTTLASCAMPFYPASSRPRARSLADLTMTSALPSFQEIEAKHPGCIDWVTSAAGLLKNGAQ